MLCHTPPRRTASTRQQNGVCRKIVYILVDIGKNANWVGAYNAEGAEVVSPRELPNTRAGLETFFTLVDGLIAHHTPEHVLIGHEPTGVYHEAWARRILEQYAAHLAGRAVPTVEYRFFNPLQVKWRRQERHLRPRKSDRLDIETMLALAMDGQGREAYLARGLEARLRQEVGFIRVQRGLLAELAQRLRPLLDRLWPGAFVNVARAEAAHPNLPPPRPIVRTRPLERKRVRALLTACPNPHHLVAMTDEEVLAFFREHVGRAGEALLKSVRAWAAQALLPPPDMAETLALHVQALLAQYEQAEAYIEEAQRRLIPLLPQTPAWRLIDIPGLSLMDAAAYLAILGTVKRFKNANQVWAFVGFDPILDGSGDHPDRTTVLSKRGDPFARQQVYQMGYRVALHYAPVGLTYLDAWERTGSATKATIHAAHRVNRICFRLMRDDVPFEDRSTEAQKAEVARRWKERRQRGKRKQKRKRRGRRR